MANETYIKLGMIPTKDRNKDVFYFHIPEYSITLRYVISTKEFETYRFQIKDYSLLLPVELSYDSFLSVCRKAYSKLININ
jgi:phenylalanyl-tRNA synthetase beta subunit